MAAMITPRIKPSAFWRRQLVPQDPSDEPASALLARIEASRGGQTTSKPRGRRPAKRASVSN
jgi:hypothetical protein